MVGDQLQRQRHTAIRRESRRQRVHRTSSSWRWRTSRPTTLGRATRAGSFAYFGAGTGTSPLPIYLAYLNGSTDAGNPAAYANAATTWANSAIAGRLAAPNPNPNGGGRRPRRQPDAPQPGAGRRATRRTSSSLNPAVNNVNVTDSGAFSDYHAMQLELRRRLSRGLSANVNYQYAFAERLARSTASASAAPGRCQTPATRPPRDQDAGGLDGAVRPRSAVRRQTSNRFVNALHRRLERQRRRPRRRPRAGLRQRAAGRHVEVDDLQDMYKFYRKDERRDGHRRGLDAAGRHHPEHAPGVQHQQHDGGRLFDEPGRARGPVHRAGQLGDLHPGQGGRLRAAQLLLLAPWFKRFDFGATKRFDVGGTTNFEVRFDMLNLFDTPNFNPGGQSRHAARRSSARRAAYTDASNTYDPGGRIGQLMIRFNW